MKKSRLAAFFLTMAMLFATVPAAAYHTGSLLPQVKTYQTAFADTRGTWCNASVGTVYETGLMNGKSAVKFDPMGTLTYAQIFVITARLDDLLNGGNGKFADPEPGEDWYQPYLNYLTDLSYRNEYRALYDDLQGLAETPYEPCSRYNFVRLLSVILPDSALSAINSIQVLPDVYGDQDVMAFYNAGILTGTNAYGAFSGNNFLNRGQAAAILARVIDPSQRVKFSPKSFSAAKELLGINPDSTVLTIDGYGISAEQYAYAVSANISYQETEASYGCYEKYAQYYKEYLEGSQSESFAKYLLDKYGINASEEFAVAWDVPDKGGLTPAEKVTMDTLENLKEIAVLFTHQSNYSLTAAQQSAISEEVPASLSNYYGYSKEFVAQFLTHNVLLSNMSRQYAPSSSEMNSYLAESNYFYGRCIVINYTNEELTDSQYAGDTQSEAKNLADEARQKAVSHLSDSDYFSYLCWKYSDEDHSESGIMDISALSSANQDSLKLLSTGSVSAVLQEGDDTAGAYYVLLKDDPFQDESVVESIGSIPAQAKLAEWAANAQVAATSAYNGFHIETIAKAWDQVPNRN